MSRSSSGSPSSSRPRTRRRSSAPTGTFPVERGEEYRLRLLSCALDCDQVAMGAPPLGIDKRFDLMQGFCQGSELRLGALELATSKRRGGDTVEGVIDRAAAYLALLEEGA